MIGVVSQDLNHFSLGPESSSPTKQDKCLSSVKGYGLEGCGGFGCLGKSGLFR